MGGHGGLILRGWRGAGFSQLSDISINVLEEFQHTELVHGDDKGSFDVMDDLSSFPVGEGERGHPGEEREEAGVLEECLSEGIKGRANVKKGVNREGKGFVSKIFGDLLHVGSGGEIVVEAVGVEGNIDRLNAFPFGGKGEREKDDFGRGRGTDGGFPTSVGFSGGGVRCFGNGGDSGDGGGGEDSRHVGCLQNGILTGEDGGMEFLI
jgi:hypothetical protein